MRNDRTWTPKGAVNGYRSSDGWLIAPYDTYWVVTQPDGKKLRDEINRVRMFGSPDGAKAFVDKFHREAA